MAELGDAGKGSTGCGGVAPQAPARPGGAAPAGARTADATPPAVPGPEDARAARARIAGQIAETPFLHSRTLSSIAGCELHLKFENLQFTASFKERGALNKLLSLDDDERRRGVIAVSAGNHAQGVAHHATRLGIPSVIVMPKFAPFVKIDNTERLGAEVVLAGETFDEARARMQELASERAMTIVHPYDDPLIVAGQATLGLEMLEAVPELDHLVVPIGGGGLIAGIAMAARHLKPAIAITGVQSERFAAAWCGFYDRPPPEQAGMSTIAEGIAVENPGRIPMALIRTNVDEIVLVDEGEIERAIVLLLEVEKTVVEGAGAAGLAAVLKAPQRFAGKRVGLVLCGGNIDSLTLADAIERHLVRSRRMARLLVTARDVPGSLARIATILGEQGANIEEVTHQRAFADLPVRYVRIDVVVSARGAAHLDKVIAALRAAGFTVDATGGA
ncbi:MAG: threonine ammonia-lyase [Burkholderiaceae bacterium]|nr:threonine ammonia-lyase [Burkholderiaceae bacterium]